jgi:hypothetical protein
MKNGGLITPVAVGFSLRRPTSAAAIKLLVKKIKTRPKGPITWLEVGVLKINQTPNIRLTIGELGGQKEKGDQKLALFDPPAAEPQFIHGDWQ